MPLNSNISRETTLTKKTSSKTTAAKSKGKNNHIEVTPLHKHFLQAYQIMCSVKAMSDLFDEQKLIAAKYVHATSRGHEAIQCATGLQLLPCDWVSPYYRDDALLMSIGFTPAELMMQLQAKANDPFSGGRNYYSHPASNLTDRPRMVNQSAATGMQVIPATGIAQGLLYREQQNLNPNNTTDRPVVVCSLGDGSVTEGEVSEAFQFAALKQLPIIFLVQDNEWGISVSADESRSMNAYQYAAGFVGLNRITLDGTVFAACYKAMQQVIANVRQTRQPILVHASVPLLNHHTSGVRKEWYRTEDDLNDHRKRDPLPKLFSYLLKQGQFPEKELTKIANNIAQQISIDFENVVASPDPLPETIMEHIFAPTPITTEQGERSPANGQKTIMVDAALHAIDEIMRQYPDAVFYGQDVGRRLGGVFREAATLAEKYGDNRVFNTAIQEAYIVGSTIGMSAVGLKPIVEIQFADYYYTAMNQTVVEMAKSCYLSCGKYPIQALIRVPIGAYGSGGPYHSGSIESTLATIKGIKVVYPSNAADLKGLLKAAFLDPNPVIMLEHKGLYWSKVPGTEAAKSIEPDENYIIPIGVANIYQAADAEKIAAGQTAVVITYGMGVHWALNASKQLPGQIEILDLRTIAPLDETAIYKAVQRHGKVLILTEDTISNSIAQAIAGRIAQHCFTYLDAPVQCLGALDVPAIPLNTDLEQAVLPNANKVAAALQDLLAW